MLQEFVWLGGTLIVVLTNSTTAEPRVYYAYSDHLNAPRVIVNAAGDVRWRWISEPFGTTAAETIPNSLENLIVNLRFPGQYFDKESGLSYNYLRDYDGTMGRYLQSDPIGLDGGVNTYAYVNGSPLSYYDAYGLWGMDDVYGAVHDWTGGWEPSQESVDFGGGFGDVVTFGITRQLRNALDISSVNRCSKWYTAGEVSGVAASVVVGYAAGTRAFARHISPNNGSNFSHSLFPKKFLKRIDNPLAKWMNKTGNRMNGDYIPTTGARPDLHDLMDATAARIGGKFPTWPLWRRLLNRMPNVPGGAIYGVASYEMNQCECGN